MHAGIMLEIMNAKEGDSFSIYINNFNPIRKL